MTTMTVARGVALAMVVAVPASGLRAQDVAARVAAVKDGYVQLTYTPRAGVCGDGRSFVRIGRSTYVGSWNGDRLERDRCDAGPVRVIARVRDGVVDEVRHYVGGASTGRAEVTDLGTVSAPAAAQWLLDVARRGPSRSATKAILPAVLADSAVIWRELLAIARDDERTRDTRREAANWLSHFASAAVSGAQPGELDFETGVGADGSDESEVKKSAVFALSQLRDNSGVPQLIDVARTNKDAAVRRSALFWLGQSGDPRGLAVFEELLSKSR